MKNQSSWTWAVLREFDENEWNFHINKTCVVKNHKNSNNFRIKKVIKKRR